MSACPNCGYCPTCGRSNNNNTYQFTPYQYPYTAQTQTGLAQQGWSTGTGIINTTPCGEYPSVQG